MINIKAKREKNGIITHLKSEYGNIFSRDVIIESMKKGYKYFTLSNGRENNKICLIKNSKGMFLSTGELELSAREEISSDIMDCLPLF